MSFPFPLLLVRPPRPLSLQPETKDRELERAVEFIFSLQPLRTHSHKRRPSPAFCFRSFFFSSPPGRRSSRISFVVWRDGVRVCVRASERASARVCVCARTCIHLHGCRGDGDLGTESSQQGTDPGIPRTSGLCGAERCRRAGDRCCSRSLTGFTS